MSITQKEVEHIAELARIELSAEEKKHFETELSGILAFVEKLNEADTSGVEPINGGTMLMNIMRLDSEEEAVLEGKSAHLMDAVPEKRDNFARVKSVFE